MTEPLINRDGLTEAIYRGYDSGDYSSADAVLAYLRSVLTPEALEPYNFRPSSTQGVFYGEKSNGTDLHRRIFGVVSTERPHTPESTGEDQ